MLEQLSFRRSAARQPRYAIAKTARFSCTGTGSTGPVLSGGEACFANGPSPEHISDPSSFLLKC